MQAGAAAEDDTPLAEIRLEARGGEPAERHPPFDGAPTLQRLASKVDPDVAAEWLAEAFRAG